MAETILIPPEVFASENENHPLRPRYEQHIKTVIDSYIRMRARPSLPWCVPVTDYLLEEMGIHKTNDRVGCIVVERFYQDDRLLFEIIISPHITHSNDVVVKWTIA